jgi:hypothetical protein
MAALFEIGTSFSIIRLRQVSRWNYNAYVNRWHYDYVPYTDTYILLLI